MGLVEHEQDLRELGLVEHEAGSDPLVEVEVSVSARRNKIPDLCVRDFRRCLQVVGPVPRI